MELKEVASMCCGNVADKQKMLKLIEDMTNDIVILRTEVAFLRKKLNSAQTETHDIFRGHEK